MDNDQNSNGNENTLNDAVENVTTSDASTESNSAQERQNQQNTAASVTATGVENADLTDEVNQALEDNPTGAGSSGDEGASSGAAPVEGASSESAGSEGSESSVVDSQAEGGATQDAASSSSSSAQSVGGQASDGVGAQAQADSEQDQGAAPSASASGAAASSSTSSQASGANEEGPDTATVSETFEVNVEEEPESEEDFDTETVSETFEINVEDVNDAPDVTGGIIASVDEDNTIIITQEQLLANASDVEGDDLTALNLATNDPNATIVANDDGSYSITPSQDFHGDIAFTYDVSDGEDVTATTLNLTVNPVNDAPEAEDLGYTIQEDGSLTFTEAQLLVQASDVDGDNLSIDSVTYSDTQGVLSDNGDGTYTFSPNENFNGEVEFDFTVSDGTTTTSANINVTVEAVNDLPVAGPTSYTINEDEVLIFNESQLLVNASDVEGDVELVSVTYNGNDGILTDNGDGTFSFAPNQNFDGDVSLDVVVVDEEGATVSTTAEIDVLPINDAPVQGEQAYTVNEDGTITISQDQLLAGSSDVEGDDLTASNLTVDGNATVEANDDGSFTITPDADFNGDISMQFDITDGTDTIQATGDLTVNPVNDLPQPQDQAFTIAEDGTLNFTDADLLDGATDIDGDNLSVESISYTGTDGVLTDNGDGSYSFAPNENFNGDVQFSFEVSDGTDTVEANIDVSVTPENDPPVAGSTSYTVNEDEVLTFSAEQLLANASDIEGDVAVDSVTYSGNDGILTDNGDGTFSFAPNQNFDGDVSLDVVVVDEEGATVSTTAEIDVLPINDAPVQGEQAYTVNEDGSITISQDQLLAGSSDVEGDDLTASNLTVDGNATVEANDDGSFTITPDADFNGDISMQFDITDGTDTIQATGDLTVNPVNDLPQPQDQAFTIAEDGTLNFTDADLLEGATDIDGDNLSVESISYTGTDGVLTDNGDGSYSFAPNENFNGDVQFSFEVSDGTDTVEANIDVSVTPENDPPVAGSTAYTVNEDEVLTFSAEQLLANASDIEGDVAVDSVTYSGNDGILTDNGDGTFSFAPNQNFDGDVSLDVAVVDEEGATVSTTAEIDVLPINDAPVQGEQAYTVNEDGTITISQDQLLAGSSDVEGDDLTASNLTVDGNATVEANDDGSFTITPDADFNGDISMQFDITDGTDTIQATGDLTVNPVNDLPQPQDQAFTIAEDGTLNFTDADLLEGATDIDGENLSVESISYTGTDGVLTDNGDGSYSFAPNENFNGDVQFSFEVSDGTDTVEANIDVSVTPENDPPVAGSTSYTVNEDEVLTFSAEQLLANASDIEGDVAVDSVTYSGNDGILTDNGDGTFSFAPNQNFDGDVSLDVVVVDEEGATVSTTAEIDVLPINDAPVQGEQAYTVNEDGSITISQDQLLAGSSDVEGDDLTASNLTVDGNATVEANDDGSFTITPDADFNGDISMQFDITDGTDTIQATGDLTVNPVNDLPQPQDQAFTIAEDGTLNFTDADLLEGATDIDGENLSVESISYTGTDGVLTDNGDGSYSFAPNENFNGDVQFSFEVSDGTDTVEANIDVSVTPENDPPVAGSTAYTVNEDEVLTFSAEQLLANASDIEGDVAVDSVTYSGNDGILTDNGDGTFSFAPNQNFDGDVSLDVVVVDEEGATVSTTAEIDVLPINDAPVQGEQAYTVNEDGSITISQDQLLAGSSDVEGDDLTASNLTVDGNATVEANDDGSFTITPDADFNGDISMQFDITDGTDTIQATGDLTVNPVNDLPQPQDQAFTIAEDGTLNFTDADLLEGATDIDGENLSVESISYTGTDGVLTDNGDGSYSFAPNENFNGDVQFSFEVSDGTDTVEANIDVSVTPENDPPVAGSTAYTVNEDEVLTFSAEQLLANASDIEGDVAVDSVTYSGNDGILTDNGDGTFSFAPNQNFDGDVSLDVVVVDEEGATVSTTAEIDVLPINDAPVQGEQAYTVNEDGTITISQDQLLAGSSDVEGDDLTASNLTVDGNATVEANDDGSFTITPDADFNGDISMQFDITDGTDTIQATGDLTVNPVNDLPQPQDQAFTIAEDGTLNFTDADLLEGATDIDGENLSVESISYTGTDGVLTDNGDGSYSFAPNENFNGDVQFSFEVSDGTDTVEANIDVSVTPENDPPVAGSTAYTVNEDEVLTFSAEQLLANASDIEGDVAVDSVTYSGNDGILTDNGDGTFSFAPNQNFDGDVSLDVVVVDEEGATVSTTAEIDVLPINDAPVQGEQAYTVNEDGSITISQDQLLAGSSDVEGDDLTASNLTVDGNATVEANDDGSFTITPDADFNGDISMQFDITDGTDTIQATGDLTVNPVNDLPQPQDQAFTIAEDGTLNFTDADLLEGATDIDGENLSVESISYTGTDGVLTDNGDGSYSFAPNENFNGDVQFSFEVSDGTETVAANIDVSVTPENDPPVAGSTAYTVNEDEVLTFSAEQLLANASDIEGDVAVDSVTYSGNDGILTDNGDGTFSFAPNQNFDGDVSLDVVVVDEEGATVSTTAEIDVLPINDAPVQGEQAYTVNEDGSITISQDQLLAGSSDVEGDDLTASNLTVDGNATVEANDDGSFTITPDADFNGDISMQFDITDGTDTIQATGDLTVNPVNDLPQPQDQAFTIAEDGTLNFTDADLLEGATDIDGENLSVESISYTGTDGVLTDNGDGSYSFAPNENFNGDVQFSFEVSDGTDTVEANIDVSVTPENDPPVAGSTAYTVNEDEVLTFSAEQLLANASDIEGDVAVDSVTYSGNDGILTDNGDGTFSFAPNQNFDGDVSLDVVVVDEEGATVSTTAEIDVLPINDAPVQGEQAYTVNEDGSITISQDQLLAGSSDVEGDDLTASNLTVDGNATVEANDDGSFTITPDADFNGDISMQFDITDGTDTIQATGDLTVNPVNDLPQPQDQAFTIAEDGTLNFTDADLLDGATDIDGENLSVESISYTGTDGVLTDNGDGSYSFAPNENFNGDVQFSFEVSDGTDTVEANIDVSVTPENDPPVAGSTSYTVNEDEVLTFSAEQLLANASDIEGDVAVDSVTYSGNDGILTDNGDGTFSFAPNQNFDGDVSLDVVVVDEEGATVSTTAEIDVLPINDAPVQGEQAYTVNEDGSITISQDQLLAGSSDVEGDDLTASNLTVDGNATVEANDDGSFTITPDADFNGDISMQFDITDGTDTIQATGDLTVNPVNDLPQPQDQAFTIAEDGTLNFTDADLLEGATDIDGENLSVESISYTGTDGVLTDNGDGSYSFAPNENFNGDVQFSFEVSDGTDTVEANIDVSVTPENDPPVAGSTSYTVNEDEVLTFSAEQLLANASDIEGDVAVDSVTYTGNDGILTDNGDGTFSFAPNQNFDGDVSLDVVVVDEEGATVSTTAEIDVLPINDAPVQGEQAYTVNEDGTITISQDQLLAGSSDVEGDDLTASNLTVDGNATVEANDDGSFTITPDADFNGDISMQFDITDGTDTIQATGDLTVNPVNDLPQPQDQAFTIAEDGTLNFTDADLLEGATDIDGENLSVESISYTGTDGVLTDNGDGSYSFAPNENFNGDVQFSFEVSDGTDTVEANIDVSVTPENDPPVAGSTSYTVNEDEVLTFSAEQLLANASDIEGDVAVDSVTYSGNDGILTDNGDGTFSFAPNQNFDGDVSLDVAVVDEEGATVSTTAEIDVLPINDAPVQGEQAYTVNEDGTITISQDQLLAGSSDVEGDDLTASNLTVDGNATVEANDDGSFTITPDADFNGDITMQFDITDGTDTIQATGDLTVNPVNDLPQPQDQAFTIAEDGTLNFTDADLLDGTTDIDGDNLSVESISYTGTDGVLTDNGDGSYSFAPNENFNGDVQFSFEVSDGTDTVEANIDVSVTPENDPPVAGSTSYTVNEDEVLTFSAEQLLANASDIEGDVAVDSVTYSGNDGILTDNGDGTFSFAPNQNFDGDVSLDVVVVDEEGATVSTTAEVDVLPINDAPVQGEQAYTVNEDGSITISQDQLLAGSSDVEGDDLTASNLTVDGNATVEANDDGSFTITPDADFNGDISMQFDITDGTDTIQATGDLTVNPVNDLPQPQDQAFTIAEDGTLNFTDADLLTGATDIDGDNLSVESISYTGTDGVLTDNGDGSYSFAPNENFNGDVQFSFEVSDGTDTVEANIDVSVTPENDPPVAGSTSYTMAQDGTITISSEQLLANSSDIEGDVFVDSVSYPGSFGNLTDNGDGTYTFEPSQDFAGNLSLNVTVIDEGGATAQTTADIEVLAAHPPIDENEAPEADVVNYTMEEDGSLTFTEADLLAHANDPDGDDLSIMVDNYYGNDGIFTHNGDGSFTFSPNENFNGNLSINYAVDDGEFISESQINIVVTEVNDPPVSGSTSYTVNEDGSITISQEQLLAGSSDVEGDALTASNLTVDGNAEVIANEDGSFTITPDADWNGDIDMHFDITDGTDTIQATADLTVNPVNDLPTADDKQFVVQEDGTLIFTDADLLQGAADIDGDNLTIDSVSYQGTDGILTDAGDGTYVFAPNDNFNGNVDLSFQVNDGTESVSANIDIQVAPVDDAPTVDGGLAYTIDEDGQITLSQEQLLTHANDIDGDVLVAQNLSVDGNSTVTANDDGSFTITPDADWNGDIDISFDVSDGNNVVQGSADLTVNPVNDAPDAGDELFIQAEEDQTVGVTLREEPAIRLDQAPEHGIIEANLNDEWIELEVGVEIPADTEVRFVPNDDVSDSTHTTQIGTFDDNASVDDWGTEVDPYTREFTDGDLTVTVQSNDDPLGAWNGNTHIGHGIGDTDRQGLSGDEKLTVTVEGQDINEISFHLDGVGGWFMEESRHFTEVEIKAFNADGEMIDSLTYHKEDRNSYETDYTLTVSEPVSYFELGTIQGNGTYVVQNMTVSQTCPDEAVFTSLGVDGTEITESVTLNIHADETEIDLTAELPNVEVDTEGAAQFASIVITEEQLLAQASDIDSDNLDIQNLELVGDNSEHATLTDNGDGTWTVTPDANFYGEIELGYQVTDGELTDDNIININFASVNDAPIVSGPIVLSTDEDIGISFTAEDLLANASDIEGDALSISEISYSGENGELIDNQDGTFTFMPNENFNGEVDIDYKVFDGTDEVDTHIDLTVIPVNDVPVPGAPLHTQMMENGSMIIEAKDLLSGASDVDGDILHIENLLLADQSQGSLTDNGDNTFTFEPAEDFYGEVNLTFDISDGIASAPSTARIDVEMVNEGPEVSAPVEAVVDEDGTITITQEDLLANASDVDGDALRAVNLQTNDPNASIVENPDGSFTITPSENFFGEVEFTYDVTDAIETVSTGLNLTVNPVNDLPDVPDVTFNTYDGDSLVVTQEQLLAQATDIEGDDLTALNVTSQNDNVSVVDNGDGTFTINTDQGYFGSADLTFDVSDGTDIVSANIDLQIEFVNDAPEAEAVSAEVAEDGSILVTQAMLLENASDVDGDALFASNLSTNDPNATVVDNGDGTFTVTPSTDFNGQIQFDYEVSDGELSTTTQLNLDVTPVNDAPEADAVSFDMLEDGTLLITDEQLLANVTDIDGDDLSVSDVSYSGEQGSLVDNGNGTYSFTPSEHFSGELQFNFTVSDGEASVSQVIDVNVEAVADAPNLNVTDGDGSDVGDSTIVTEPGGTVELNIAATLVDQDLSETLTVEVNGIPEGTVIRYDNEEVLGNQDSGITSYNDTEITVTFEGESAGFRNSAGYYKVDEDGNITGVDVVYENASQVGSGGDLLPGESSFSFPIEEGESFNLFLVPNGFPYNDFDSMENGSFEFRDSNGDPATIHTEDPQLVFVDEDGSETVIRGAFGDAVFHGGTTESLNQDGIEHTRTTINDDGELVYGFEDLYGGGDRDFNDFNFTIDVGEVNSQIYSGEITVGESGSVVLPTTAISQTLELEIPQGIVDSFDIEVSATATELSNQDTETVSQTITIDIEHAPEAAAVNAEVDEDGSIVITQEMLLENATDLDGDTLTALNLTTENDNVTVTDNGDGSYTLTPDADFNGDVQFTFDVSDGDDVVSTNLELTVTPVNDLPEPEDKAFTIAEDGTLNFTDADLLDGATDIDGDNLSVESISYTGTDGVLTDNGDGSYSFAPNENFNGDVQFSFEVSDGTETVAANIDVSVTPENDPPVAGSTAYTVNEDEVLTFSAEQLLANASDIEGDVAVDSVTYSGNDGILTDNGDGTFSFAPNQNFDGDVSLDVVVVDEEGATVSTTAEIDVLPINDAPVQGEQAYTVNEDGSITISQDQLLAGSSDVEGDDLTASNLTVDGNATVEANSDGSFTITPDADFNGDISMQFDITDGTDTIQATGDLTVNPVNDLPQPQDQAFTIAEDGTLNFTDADLLTGATDIDGDNLSVESISYSGTDGVLTDNGDGSYSFAPNENFHGDVQFSFEVSDGTETVAANIDVSVTPENDPPVAGSTAYTVNEDEVLTFSAEQLLANASDVEGDVAVDSVTYSGNDGILTDNGDGTFSFAPNQNFDGDVSLDVVVVDEEGATATTTAEIDVLPINDAPVQGEQAYTVNEDGSITISQDQLLAGSSDVEGDGLTASNLTVDGNATVEANDDGSFTITPDADFNGDITMQFDITDGTDTIQATGDLTVNPVNDLPQPQDQAFTIAEDGTLNFTDADLLTGATDIDGDNLSVESISYTGTDGVLTDNGDGSYSFAPNENFNGDVQFSFEVSDGTETVAANIDVSVTPENDPPVAGSTSYTINEDSVITISAEQLLANSSDVEGEVVLEEASYSGTDGIFTDNGDGTFSFAPNENFFGDITLDITVADEDGVTADTVAGIDVIAVNDAPVSGDLAYSINEDGAITFSQSQLLAKADDVDGDDLVATNLSAGDNATVTDNGDGTFTVTPDANFNGDIDLTFDISDGEATVEAGIDLTVNPVNDAATAQDHQFEMDEDGLITITDADLLQGASDIDGDDLSVSSVSYTGDEGVFTNNGDGSYSFAPNENFSGEVNLSYGVSDGTEVTPANIGITVNEVNDAPIAGTTSYSVNEDGSITLSDAQLLANSSDVEGAVSVADVSYTGNDGSFVDNGDGTYTFTPTENFNGAVSLDVTVSDEAGETAQATAAIDVVPVNDAPVAPTLELNGEEDQVLVIDPAYILANATDLDGDDLSLESLTVRQPQNATLQPQPDGMYHLVAPADFNGLIDLAYEISDGTETVEGSINVDVIPVNDAPFNEGNAHLTTHENGAFTFDANDMLDLFGDIDTDNLVVSRIIMPEGEDGGELQDNGDGTWTFTPTGDFAGTSGMQVVVSDGEYETSLDVPVFVRPVADGAVITTDHEGPLVFSEDSTGHLGLNVDLLDSSEILTNLVITGFPVGFEVSDGEHTVIITQPGQYIDVTEWDVGALALTPPEDFSGNFFITVTATTADYGDENSQAMAQPTEASGDFQTEIDDSIILTADDLLDMVENAAEGEVEHVHLLDRSQGEITDNGDGTWTFVPADGFEGTVDVGYVVNDGGNLIDAQTSIGVQDDNSTAPQVDSIATTNLAHDSALSFTDEDMLAQVSDLQGDELSIESVQLIDGQGILETDQDGHHTFTPVEGFYGEATIGFVATDGDESVRSHFNVNVAEDASALTMSDDGSVVLEQETLLQSIDTPEGSQVTDLDHSGDDGTVIDNGDGSWTFWPDDNFSGELSLSAEVTNGDDTTQHDVTLQVENQDGAQNQEVAEEPEQAADVQSSSSKEIVVDMSEQDVADEVDVTAAPGGTANIAIPDELSAHDSVEQVEISGLPEGAVVENALPGEDGSFILSGDLSQSASLTLGDSFEGTADIQFQGLDSIGNSVEEASAQVTIEVEEQHSMQSGGNTNRADSMFDSQEQGGDWMSGDNTNTAVDVMDDSSSYDNVGHGHAGTQDTNLEDNF